MAPPQFPHYRWRGLPKVVQQQLYRLGVGAAECVLCGARQHGCYDCPQRSSPNGWAMWQAWERRWLLLQAKELEIYALSGTEGEYLRRSGAVFARSVVTRAVVAQFRWPAAGQQPKTAMRAPMPASPSPQRSAPQRVVAFSPPQQRVPATSPPQARAQMPTRQQQPQRPQAAPQPNSKKKKNRGGKKTQRQETGPAATAPRAVPPVPAQAAAPKPPAKREEAKPPASAKPPAAQERAPAAAPATAAAADRPPSRAQLLTPIPRRPGSSQQPLPPRAPPRQGSVAPSPAPLTVEDMEVAGAFHPIQPVPAPAAQAEGSQPAAAASRPPSWLDQRTVSPSAAVLSRKSGRASEVPGVSPVERRPEAALGGEGSVTLCSQRGGNIPYSRWKPDRYLQAEEAARHVFWTNAQPEQKTEIAQAIPDKFREQDDVYQQARGMGAEAWGLGRGRGVMASLADGTESVSMVEVGGAGNIGEEGSA